MNIKIYPNIIQKFVVVESDNELFLWGDPEVKWHKDIVQKMEDSGISIVSVKGGGRLKMEKDIIYVWDKSSVYGEINFEEVQNILKEKFSKFQIINKDPQK